LNMEIHLCLLKSVLERWMNPFLNTSKLVFIMKEYGWVLCVDNIFNEHLQYEFVSWYVQYYNGNREEFINKYE
jgi:hypothetical protein